MENVNEILEDREYKNQVISKYINDYQVISLKANIPGEDKNIKESKILLDIFDKYLITYSSKKEVLIGADGIMYLYLTGGHKFLKDEMINLEEKHPLGRLVDIDVFDNSVMSKSRGYLRKCMICDDIAFVCARNKKHNLDELLAFIKNKTYDYLVNNLIDSINKSMLIELNLHPKFGLVTKYSNGSHNDMDYTLMIKAKDVIIPYFVLMFKCAYGNEDLKIIREEIKDIGLKAEREMFLITNGVNCYKGLIFDLGLIVAAYAYTLSHDMTIYDCIKEMCKDVLYTYDDKSFGSLAYKKYNIKGARGEAYLGFPHVKKIVDNYDLESDEGLYNALCYLIVSIEDTNVLKRAKSIDTYNTIKEEFKNFKYDKEYINALTDKCVLNNISFGGSADLLVCSLFIHLVNKYGN